MLFLAGVGLPAEADGSFLAMVLLHCRVLCEGGCTDCAKPYTCSLLDVWLQNEVNFECILTSFWCQYYFEADP